MSYDYEALVSEISESRKLAGEAEKSMMEESANTELKTSLIEYLTSIVDKFENLSGHCPMTPLLWMQYALDASDLMSLVTSEEMTSIVTPSEMAIQTRLQLLELGLHEFPGSAILQIHHAEIMLVSILMISDGKGRESSDEHFLERAVEQYKDVLENAIAIVGDGSHRNEAKLVVELFHLQCHIEQWSQRHLKKKDGSQASQLARDNISRIFQKRAMIPMSDGVNDGLGGQYGTLYRTIFDSTPEANVVARIEENRRREAKYFGLFNTFEDDIDIALHNESGVSNRNVMNQVLLKSDCGGSILERNHLQILQKWKDILNDPSICTSGCWMGMGGPSTAQAYFQYAQASFRFRLRAADDDEIDDKVIQTTIQNMAISIFERGVAECPTIDTLWLSYLRRLQYQLEQTETELRDVRNSVIEIKMEDLQKRKTRLLNDLLEVAERAIRNCPYSSELVKVKMKIQLSRVNAGLLVLDPEDLMTELIVEQTLGNGFVEAKSGDNIHPTAAIDLFQGLLDIVRKRILHLLAEAARTKGPIQKNGSTNQLQDSQSIILQYDDPEPIHDLLSPEKHVLQRDIPTSIDDDLLQELEDLCVDLREIYDEADSYLRKNHKKYCNKSTVEEGRAILVKDRALTESYLVGPLLSVIQKLQSSEVSDTENANTKMLEGKEKLAKTLRQYDKASKIWQPPHPTVYISFLQSLSASVSTASMLLLTPFDVLVNLRRMRFLYQKALKSVGKPKSILKTYDDADGIATVLSPDELDYETSLRCLCRDYLFFERYFGSDRSYGECAKAVQKKLSKAFAALSDGTNAQSETREITVGTTTATSATPMDTEQEVTTNVTKKRKRDDRDTQDATPIHKDLNQEVSPLLKEQKAEEVLDGSNRPTNFKEIQEQKGKVTYPKYKVKVGKLEYPAHPFTIKLSFLSPDTEDMDLVDCLRPKCGAVVHAKIMREKHHHGKKRTMFGKSKGWALVQFEERDAVETALSLSHVIGIKGKSVKIERSHLPAVGLVPSGMHRVNPKGEGKSTKRNLMKKNERTNDAQRKLSQSAATEMKQTSTGEKSDAPDSSSTKTNIFAFRPRVVKSTKRKAKVTLSAVAELNESADK